MKNYEVTVKLTIYARTQAEAHQVVENRLSGGMKPSEDPNALLIAEVNTKMKAVR